MQVFDRLNASQEGAQYDAVCRLPHRRLKFGQDKCPVQLNMAAYFIEVLVENQSNKPISYDIMRKDDVAEMPDRATSAYRRSELVHTEAQTDR